MPGWAGAVDAVMTAFTTVFRYVTGGRSRDERSLEEQVEALEHAWDQAVQAGDTKRAAVVRGELHRLRNQLLARRRP